MNWVSFLSFSWLTLQFLPEDVKTTYKHTRNYEILLNGHILSEEFRVIEHVFHFLHNFMYLVHIFVFNIFALESVSKLWLVESVTLSNGYYLAVVVVFGLKCRRPGSSISRSRGHMTGSGADWSAAWVLTERFLDVTQSKSHAESRRLPDWELGPGRPASADLRQVEGRSAGRRRGAASAAAGSLWEERDTRRVTPWQRAEEEKVTTATEISGRRRQLAEDGARLWTGVESESRLKTAKNQQARHCVVCFRLPL